MAIKQWKEAVFDKELAKDLAQFCDCSEFCALLLSSRGITDYTDVDEFLSTDIVLSSPYSIIGLVDCAEIIKNEIEQKGKICIFGDYDADGVTATALLYKILKERLFADVIYKVPLREDGYGIRAADVSKLHEQGVTLIVTVDNGITAFEAADMAKSLGIKFVVTDHHLPKETLPNADAIADPHIEGGALEFADYAGVGVAFMLGCILLNLDPVELIECYGDLVAIGTIADVVPLLSDNRSIVRYGCEMIEGFASCGVQHLTEHAGLSGNEISSRAIAFGLAPRINAAGRMGDADYAVQLLISEDDEICEELSAKLCQYNDERKKVEADILEDVLNIIKNDPDRLNFPILTVKGENWHFGVLGIVASKLMGIFNKPCIVFSEENGLVSGSARSFDGVSMFDVLSGAKDELNSFGGHDLAAGVTILPENYDTAIETIQDSALQLYGKLPFNSIDVSLKLNPAALSVDTVKVTQPLEPYGSCNEAPVYVLRSMNIDKITPIGKNSNHLRLELSREKAKVTAMMFFTTLDEFGFIVGDTVDLAVTLDINYFRDDETLSIAIKDIHFSTMSYEVLGLDIREYENYRAWNVVPDDISLKREDIQLLYRNIKNRKNLCANEDVIQRRIGLTHYLKTRLALDVLHELKMIELTSDEKITVKFIENPEKNPLENSKTFKQFEKTE